MKMWKCSAVVLVVVLLSGGGVAAWRWREAAKQRELAKIAELESHVSEANRVIALAQYPCLDIFPAEARWPSALRGTAKTLNRPREQFEGELGNAMTELLAVARKAPPELAPRYWLEAGDLALALYRLKEAEECYRKGTPDETGDGRSRKWADASDKLANVLHLQKKFSDEFFLRQSIAKIYSKESEERMAEESVRLGLASFGLNDYMGTQLALDVASRYRGPRVGFLSQTMIEVVGPLGIAQFRSQKLDEGVATIRRALEMCEANFGSDDWRTAIQVLNLATALRQKGQPSDAETQCQRAITIFEKTCGADHYLTAAALFESGMSLQAMFRSAEAEAAYKQALDINEKLLPADHWVIGCNLGELAHAVRTQGRLPEAERLYRGAVEIMEKGRGVETADYVNYYSSLVSLMVDTHPPKEVEPILRRSVALTEKVFGPTSSRAGEERIILGKLLQQMERYDEAKALLETGAQTMANSAGPRKNPTEIERPEVRALVTQGQLAYEAHNLLEAETKLNKALSIEEAASNPRDLDVASIANMLALVVQEGGRFTEAERLYRKSLELRLKVLGADDVSVGDSLMNVAILLKLRHQPTEALPLARRALEIYQIGYGPDHSRVEVSLNNLAAILVDLNRGSEAEPLQRKSVAIAEKRAGVESDDALIRLNYLAIIIEQDRRFKDAEPVLRRMMKTISKKDKDGASNPARSRDIQGRYTRCLSSLGLNPQAIDERIEHLKKDEKVTDL